MTAAVEGGRDRLIHIGLHRCAQQTAADQKKQLTLAQGQGGDIRFLDLQCWDDGVVVGYVLVGDHGLHQRIEIADFIKGRQLRRQVDHTGGRFRHIGGQIPAVRAGIGQQLFS